MRNTLTISKPWWESLVPKQLIPRRREVEALINEFIIKESYGKEWAAVAKEPNGVFRLKMGQIVPTIHITFLGENPGFIAPLTTIREGHRSVWRGDKFESGKDIEAGEIVLAPIISVDLVTDPLFINALQHDIKTFDESKVVRPSLLFSIPAHYLLSPQLLPNSANVLYQHIFGRGASYPFDGYFYVGVTKRSWQQRWSEHQRAIKNNSQLRFHRKFREEQLNGRLTYVHHKVMGITDNLEALYEAEEFLVEKHWDDERRMNMIPGGKSGLRYLREHGMLKQSVVPVPDERDGLVKTWLSEHPRKGLPAPWISEKWRDNDWAVAQICRRDDRLSVNQIRAIRELSKNFSAEEIFIRIGAKDVHQVNRVLDGKTYTRIK